MIVFHDDVNELLRYSWECVGVFSGMMNVFAHTGQITLVSILGCAPNLPKDKFVITLTLKE